MSAQAWERRREGKRLHVAMHHVFRDPTRMITVRRNGKKAVVVLGDKHPLYALVVEHHHTVGGAIVTTKLS